MHSELAIENAPFTTCHYLLTIMVPPGNAGYPFREPSAGLGVPSAIVTILFDHPDISGIISLVISEEFGEVYPTGAVEYFIFFGYYYYIVVGCSVYYQRLHLFDLW